MSTIGRCGGRTLTAIVAIAIGFVAVGILGVLIGRNGSPQDRISRLPLKEQQWVIDFEAMMKRHRTQYPRLLHSVDPPAHRVRISPEAWCLWSLEQKRAMIEAYSRYFRYQTGSGRVDILSDRNDQKLASYSAFKGIQIHQ